jgi:outer membrane protein TolC
MFIKFGRLMAATIAISASLQAGASDSKPLTLDAAIRMALSSDDPYLLEPTARAAALAELAVSDGQLPDPKVRMAFANWPTNSFSYSQEAMTQLQVGVTQAFPRGDTRRLKRQKREIAVSTAQLDSSLRQLNVIKDTRLAWLDIYYWNKAKHTVQESRQAITELLSVTHSNFATGKNKSQDVFRAEMELALLDDKLLDIAQQTELVQARLSRRLGSAGTFIPAGQPAMKHPTATNVTKSMLAQHPAAAIANSRINSAEKNIAIAGEQYKPGWAVNVGYGARGGDRSDFASVGVTLDVPLFTKNRQARGVSSAKKMRQAQQLSLNATLLDLEKQLASAATIWTRTTDRITLYKHAVQQRAKETSEASIASYQAGTTDFPELIRTRLAELNIELTLLRLENEKLKAQAELLFLEGEDDA